MIHEQLVKAHQMIAELNYNDDRKTVFVVPFWSKSRNCIGYVMLTDNQKPLGVSFCPFDMFGSNSKHVIDKYFPRSA